MGTDRLLQKAAERVRAREGKEAPRSIGQVFARARDKVEASPEERLRRLSICETCEHAKVRSTPWGDSPYCGACGCPLSSRTRLKWAPLVGEVHCPKGKW